MLSATDSPHAPWYMRDRLNCLTHFLSLIPCERVPRDEIKFSMRSHKGEYDDQASLKDRTFVPEKY